MKSPMLLSLILSFSVACSSTPDENESENLNPEAGAPASVEAAKPETEVKKVDSNDVAAAVDAKLDAKAESAKATEAVAAPAPAAEAVAPAASAEKLVYPTASLVNVRQGPGKSHAVARVAKFGEAISLTGEQKNSWLKTTDGLWVSSLFTAESKPAQANDPVVQAAPAAEAEAPKTVETIAEPVAPATEEASAPAAP
ncbi:MAG TPA: SH3 domain-containing protein [Oligoflexus sp.]|uniref:SH3 domain-containing protein n=1 Tax=Oligoflexus sp. TaxID=1971216 RepID=UPI002D750826|nr:SH3 domain-containing protein [Oligoflexus sp.]HYX36177.1 SH3 domain-containing protein [Oligoflexus sp.]